MHEGEAVDAATAAGDRVGGVADAVVARVGAIVVRVVVASGAGVPLVAPIVVGVLGVVDEIVVVEGVVVARTLYEDAVVVL